MVGNSKKLPPTPAKIVEHLVNYSLHQKSSVGLLKSLMINMENLPKVSGIDPAVYHYALGGPVTTKQVEKEMRDPRSPYFIYAARVMQVMLSNWLVSQKLMVDLTIYQLIRKYIAVHASSSSRSQAIVEVDGENAIEPECAKQMIELRHLIDMSEAEVNEVLKQFEPQERIVMAYSIDAAKQMHQDTQMIIENINNNTIFDAAAPEDKAKTAKVLQEWQEVHQLHVENDAKLLEQPDLKEIINEVPVCMRECKRNVNKELTRNLLQMLFKKNSLKNIVVDDMADQFKKQDEAVMKKHMEQGLQQFKFKPMKPTVLSGHDAVERLSELSMENKVVRPVYSDVSQQQRKLDKQQYIKDHCVVNDTYANLDSLKKPQLLLNQLVAKTNQCIANYLVTLKSAEPTEEQQIELNHIMPVYQAIDTVKSNPEINMDSTRELQQQLKLIAEECRGKLPESQFAVSLLEVASDVKFTIQQQNLP